MITKFIPAETKICYCLHEYIENQSIVHIENWSYSVRC
jgi:hypothetical protein